MDIESTTFQTENYSGANADIKIIIIVHWNEHIKIVLNNCYNVNKLVSLSDQ